MIQQEYRVNMVPEGRPTVIHVRQYDGGSRTLSFQLYGGGLPWEVPEGATVTIDGTKADGKGFSYIATASGSTVTVTVEKQMTAAAGRAACQLTVTKGEKVLGSASLILDVEGAALPEDADMPKTDIASLETWKNQALNASAAAEAAQGKAETAQGKAETAETNAKSSATAAASSASTASTKATAAATSASNAASSATAAQTAKAAAETAQGKAETAEANAASSATTASTKASAASTSASNAASSATAAATSASNAASSASAAAASAAEADTKNKADKKVPSTAGNIATLDASGNLADSGKQPTAAGIGAAAASHTHGAGDITSGTLPVSRGGTGGTTAATARSSLGAAAASHTHGAGDITSGTLPIARGGTGGTTAEAARSSLGIANSVTSTGTSGNWRYRKWSDGFMECWCTDSQTTKISYQNGSIYGSLGFTLDFPVTFSSSPMVFASTYKQYSTVWTSFDVISTTQMEYSLTSPQLVSATSTYETNIYACGYTS